MKTEQIVLSSIITILIGFFILLLYAEFDYKNKCDLKEGVVVRLDHSRNCWKDNGFIKID